MDSKKKNKFGIIQGRLSKPPGNELQWFPIDTWKDEFSLANKLGISFIEFFSERDFNPSNPIWSDEGRNEIIEYTTKSGVEIYSSCTDYVINNSLLSDYVAEHIYDFIDASSILGCKLVVLPLFGKSEINSSNLLDFKKIIQEFSDFAHHKNVLIGIEAALSPLEYIHFLEEIDLKDRVRCVFDTGNRALVSKNIAKEIEILKDWICHVHIKDKNDKDQNVVLGTGLVNFREVFNSLCKINYLGPLVFETDRGEDPLKTAIYNINLCNFFYNEALE